MKYLTALVMFVIMAHVTLAQESSPLAAITQSLSQIDVRAWYVETHEIADERAYADIEARVFAWLHWGADDIAWFRDVYSVMNDPHEYINSVYEAMQVLEDAQAPTP